MTSLHRPTNLHCNEWSITRFVLFSLDRLSFQFSFVILLYPGLLIPLCSFSSSYFGCFLIWCLTKSSFYTSNQHVFFQCPVMCFFHASNWDVKRCFIKWNKIYVSYYFFIMPKLVLCRPRFWHDQGVRPHRGIHHFGVSTNQKILYLFELLFYIDYTMRNQVHNIYDIYDILY